MNRTGADVARRGDHFNGRLVMLFVFSAVAACGDPLSEPPTFAAVEGLVL
jgi:hypothetical protein